MIKPFHYWYFVLEQKVKKVHIFGGVISSKFDKIVKQAGAELGQAQPELGFGENDLSLRGCIRGWS